LEFPYRRILLVKTRTVPFEGYWALLGERVDAGKIVEQTVVREVKERARRKCLSFDVGK